MKDWSVLIPITTLVLILAGLVHGIRFAAKKGRKR